MPLSEYLLVVVLALIAIGAVAFPVLVGRERYPDSASLDADVQRYREALRAGTLCGQCQEANAPDSVFCRECGAGLG